MGTDITCYAEMAAPDGQWAKTGPVFGGRPEPSDQPFGMLDRDYQLFAFLAGVRNVYGIEPISAPRGLPPDVTAEVRRAYDEDVPDVFAASWLAVPEMVFFDYNQKLAARLMPQAAGLPLPDDDAAVADFLMGSGYFDRLAELAALCQGVTATRVVFWFS